MTEITKQSGELEKFEDQKLIDSLKKSGAEEDIAQEILRHIKKEVKNGMSTTQIAKHATFLLRKNSGEKAAVRYSLRQAVMELGPSGYPFEKFIAEILREKGYQAKVNQILEGKCIEHEIDVVAFNENKLIVIEAKFHNEQRIKSDVKTALYVRARFDDLNSKKFDYGGLREVNENWIITNTKFTSSAIQYGKCAGIKITAWNYPKGDSLQDMIEDSGLHPLTCLESLSQKQKIEALKHEVVLCKRLKNDDQLLKSLGLGEKNVNKVKEEINSICSV